MKKKINLTENAKKVLEKRYLAKDSQGKIIETPEEMLERVSKAVAKAEEYYGEDPSYWGQKFYDLMADLKFLPNSPTLMNAGRELGQLSACFVLPVEDSMEGIFETIKNAALIHKSGGGTGFSFSRLRPKGATVKSTGGVASGPVSFMRVFNAATEAVKQGGTRRGANMGILRVDHPDILEFIQCKRDNKEFTNFNISVAITDKFMEALKNDDYYELVEPHTGRIAGKLKAREVFDLIVEMAWLNGEPGIVFIDRINEKNPTPHVGSIESTNPCGEQPLLNFESCTLASINLSKFVYKENDKLFVNYEDIKDTVHTAVRFLDDVIDVNKYPLPEIEQMTKANRKIGLGVMGFADMLIKLGIPYDSEEAVKLAEEVMGFIQSEARKASEELAKVRGAFPNFAGCVYDKMGSPPVRNATVTTIAPTGTISIIAGCSSGIEPVFALAFERNVLDKQRLIEIYPLFEEKMRELGLYSDELMEEVLKKGSLKDIEGIPEDVKKVFVTAHDVSPEWHVRLQAAFQKYTDNAVSKTVNFPQEATKEDVRKVYLLAYELGCKGVTVYRDKSREEQVLNKGTKREEEDKEAVRAFSEEKHITPRPRPSITYGSTEKVKIGCGNLYITVNSDDKGICEVFTNLGRAGGCPSQSEATSRLISLALRSGIDVNAIIEQLKGIRCLSTIRQMASNKDIKVLSCPDAIARALERNILKAEGVKEERKNNGNGVEYYKKLYEIEEEGTASKENKCPECGSVLETEGGCVVCRACGFSKCG